MQTLNYKNLSAKTIVANISLNTGVAQSTLKIENVAVATFHLDCPVEIIPQQTGQSYFVVYKYRNLGYELLVMTQHGDITSVSVRFPNMPVSCGFTLPDDDKPAKPGTLQLPAHMV